MSNRISGSVPYFWSPIFAVPIFAHKAWPHCSPPLLLELDKELYEESKTIKPIRRLP